jgi:LPS export ABC transporter protein LptC
MISGRNLLWLIPLILLVTFPLWKIPVGAFLTPRGEFEKPHTTTPVKGYNFSMTGIQILQSEQNKETARIRAAKARSTAIPDVYVLEQVDADLFDNSGGITQVLAENGSFDVEDKHLELSSNVVINNKVENYTMKTDLLNYDGNDRTVHCPGKTVLQGNGIVITGTSLFHDMNTGAYTIGGRVYCTLQ